MGYSPCDFSDDVMRKLYPEGLPEGFDYQDQASICIQNLEDPIEEVAVELFNAFEESARSAPILLGCTLPEFCAFLRADDEDDRFGLTPEQFGAAQERAWTMMTRQPVKDTRAA